MGAHAFALLVRPSSSFTLMFHILSLLAIAYIGAPVLGIEEAEALLKFKSSLTQNEAVSSWNPSNPPCTDATRTSKWKGVLCANGKVWGIQLEHTGLRGPIDMDALSQLHELRTLSFKNNKFEGPMPDIRRFPKLRAVFLSNNRFSGEIPDDAFAGMDALRRVVLSNNGFTGKIPSSLTKIPFLVELKLDGNKFQGNIPEFQQKSFPNINLANNQLEGPLPARLSKVDPKFFSGNKGLCGGPLEQCTGEYAVGSGPSPNTKPKSSTTTVIVLVVLALVILALVIILVCQKRPKEKFNKQTSLAAQGASHFLETNEPPSEEQTTTTKKRHEPGKLDFVRDDRTKFDLSQLLTAPAEVLESGNFESSYKVEFYSGQLMVVKRFRQMTRVGREDFYEHIGKMGKLRHPNVLALIAYYYRKEEKLLIFDFVNNGNLASHLHGNKTQKNGGLDWPKRLEIIKGIARGLAYLYNELPSLNVPHGYLKSSNVLLNESYKPLLMDYALQPLINPENAKDLMVAYRSPEYAQNGRITKKTDVWSFGILILEVLTGKFPTNLLAVGNVKGENPVTWVNDIASGDAKGVDVIDKEMGETQHSQAEMRKLLKIGFNCCHEDLSVRWSIKEAVENIEEIKEKDELN